MAEKSEKELYSRVLASLHQQLTGEWQPAKQLLKGIPAEYCDEYLKLSRPSAWNELDNPHELAWARFGKDVLPNLLDNELCENRQQNGKVEIRLRQPLQPSSQPIVQRPAQSTAIQAKPLTDPPVTTVIEDVPYGRDAERFHDLSDFDYTAIDANLADNLRVTADKIRETVKKTVLDIIEVGNALETVQNHLNYGQWDVWLQAEFQWNRRTALHYMNVARRFRPRMEIISQLKFRPTAAYLLAAPSTPDAVLDTAIERAGNGETITVDIAREMIAKANQKGRRKKPKTSPAKYLSPRLKKVLERFHQKWDPNELPELARQLREFAAEIEKLRQNGRKK